MSMIDILFFTIIILMLISVVIFAFGIRTTLKQNTNFKYYSISALIMLIAFIISMIFFIIV